MSRDNNRQHWVIFKKSEKLATAIHMLTDFFDDNESLKWHLREESISFLSFINSFVHNPVVRITLSGIEAHTQGMLSLLELGKNAHLVSPMNFSILREEYRVIAGVLYREVESKESSSNFEFPEKFFSEESIHHVALYGDNDGSGATLKDKNILDKERIKDTNKTRDFESKRNDFYEDLSDSYKKEFRRESILKILRAKGDITIKDISYLVKGISEKTIQRELISLINEGVVRREGKRRWSRYLLKT